MVTKAYLEKLFADQIDGHQLLANNSRWGNFRTRRTQRWHTVTPQPVALLGDAAHTAHFSVGSGTKMAMEDAVALAAALAAHPDDLAGRAAAYEAAAQPSVRKIQDSARPSLSWWEHFGRYHDAFEPWQFAYHFLSRSITDARLARRAPDFVAASHRGWVRQPTAPSRWQTPFQRRGWSAPAVWSTFARPEAGPSPSPGPRRSLSEIRDRAPGVRCSAAPDSETGLPGVAAQLARARPAGHPAGARRRARRHPPDPDARLRADPAARETARVADRPGRRRRRSHPRPGGDRRAVRPRGPRGRTPMTSTVPHHQPTATDAGLSALFAPRGIAVVGASRRPGKLGATLARSLSGFAARGGHLALVNGRDDDDAPVARPPPPRQARSISPMICVPAAACSTVLDDAAASRGRGRRRSAAAGSPRRAGAASGTRRPSRRSSPTSGIRLLGPEHQSASSPPMPE